MSRDNLDDLFRHVYSAVARYDEEHPIRTADMHSEWCACHRCAIDLLHRVRLKWDEIVEEQKLRAPARCDSCFGPMSGVEE